MLDRNIFNEMIVPDYTPQEIDKLVRKCSEEASSNNGASSEYYRSIILPLLNATKKFLDQTTIEPPFKVFQQQRSSEEINTINRTIMHEITNKKNQLAQFNPSSSEAQILAGAIKFCSQCIAKRLGESRGSKNEQSAKFDR
jgi:hypothetical protein